jgi:electron transfer flavoprotein beta subunit
LNPNSQAVPYEAKGGISLKSLVCLKQVPDTETQIKVNPDGSGIVTDGIKYIINPYDEFSVEEALRQKEKFKAGDVTIISVGPDRTTEAIRTALAMGADKGVQISDPALNTADSYVTAQALAAVVKDLEYDIVFCGHRAIDDDFGAAGAMLAELLGLPQVTLVTRSKWPRTRKALSWSVILKAAKRPWKWDFLAWLLPKRD